MKNYPKLISILSVGKALVYLHGRKVVVWMVFGFALSSSNFIHLVYLILVLIASGLRSGRTGMHPIVGFFLLCFGQLVCLAQMAYGFSSVKEKADKTPQSIMLTEWLGFTEGRPWDTLRTHLAIVILVVLHRLAYWWAQKPSQTSALPLPPVLEEEKEPRVFRTSISTENVSAAIGHHSTNSIGNSELQPAPLDMGARIKAYLANFYSLYGFEVCRFFFLQSSNYFIY